MIVARMLRRGFRRGFPRRKRSVRGGMEKREVGGSKSKACVGCRTTETPLWRSGPDGPKTLCNACGIRYRKLRRKGNNHHKNQSNSSGSIGFRRTPPLSQVEAEAMKQKQKRKQEGLWLLLQQSRKFASTCGKEEAEAAVLLMALSTGLFVHS